MTCVLQRIKNFGKKEAVLLSATKSWQEPLIRSSSSIRLRSQSRVNGEFENWWDGDITIYSGLNQDKACFRLSNSEHLFKARVLKNPLLFILIEILCKWGMADE